MSTREHTRRDCEDARAASRAPARSLSIRVRGDKRCMVPDDELLERWQFRCRQRGMRTWQLGGPHLEAQILMRTNLLAADAVSSTDGTSA